MSNGWSAPGHHSARAPWLEDGEGNPHWLHGIWADGLRLKSAGQQGKAGQAPTLSAEDSHLGSVVQRANATNCHQRANQINLAIWLDPILGAPLSSLPAIGETGRCGKNGKGPWQPGISVYIGHTRRHLAILNMDAPFHAPKDLIITSAGAVALDI